MSLLILCPVAVNYIVLTPNFLPIVGDSDKWLSFFGSFIGSAIMAGITLYVLQEQLKQNQLENRQNRMIIAPRISQIENNLKNLDYRKLN